MNKEFRNILNDFEIRQEDENLRIVTGYVCKFNKESKPLKTATGDEFIEVITQDTFNRSLEGADIKALWNHNRDLILGSTKSNTLTLLNDNIGLRFTLNLPNTTAGNDAWESIKRKDVDGVSFGFTNTKDKWDEILLNNKRTFKRTLLKADLLEISPTPFPAYPSSQVSCRSLDQYLNMQNRDLLKKKLIIEFGI